MAFRPRQYGETCGDIYLHVGLLSVHQLLDDLAQPLGDGHVARAGPLQAVLHRVGVPLAVHHHPTALWEGVVERAHRLHVLGETELAN